MVACPRCTARFAANDAIEERWLAAHLARFHEASRATKSFAASLVERHAA